MTNELQKEQFSFAYVRAIAAVAGVKVERPEIDDDSIDLRFSVKSIAGTRVPPMMESQVKCTSESILKADGLHFELKMKNYIDLRGERLIPRILIVLMVPPDLTEWTHQTPEQLILKKCAYWCSLKDAAETSNTSSITIVIPTAQVFSVAALKQMLN